MQIPRDLIDLNRFVMLVADVMFVCGLPFLITLSRQVHFVTVQYMPSRSAREIKSGLMEVVKLYKRAGFIIQAALMDNEFEPLVKLLLDKLVVNTTAKNEHVGKIERKIGHLKNRSRSTKASLPYKALPKCVIKALASNITIRPTRSSQHRAFCKSTRPESLSYATSWMYRYMLNTPSEP